MTSKEYKSLETASKKVKTVPALMKLIKEKFVQESLVGKAYTNSKVNCVQPTKKNSKAKELSPDKRMGITVRTEADSTKADAIRNNLPRSPYAAKVA